MATTSLWHIKGRLKDLIDYVENPEKTASKMPELQDLYNVFSYVQRPEATQEGEYVTAINCLKETALYVVCPKASMSASSAGAFTRNQNPRMCFGG